MNPCFTCCHWHLSCATCVVSSFLALIWPDLTLLLPTHVACCASFFSTLWDVWAEIIRILIGANFYRDNVCSSVCKDLWWLWSEFEKPHTVICNSSVIAFETPFTLWLMLFPSYYLLETSLLLLLVFIGDSISNSSGCSVFSWLMLDCTCPMFTLRT